jgi:hypothetical protein
MMASIGCQSEPLRNAATCSRKPNDALVDMVCKSSRKGPSQLLGTCSFPPLVWLIPMPSCNDGIYWTPIRAIEERRNLLQKSKRRAGRYGLRIQSKRSVTITWHMQISPLVWLIPMPSRNDGIYWMPFRATEKCCNHLQKPNRRAGRYGLQIQS